MPYSNKLMVKKSRIKLDAPRLTLKGIRALSESEFEKVYMEVSNKNRDWMHQNAPDPKVSWVYASRVGEVWGYGYGNMFPSTKQVIEASDLVKTPLFLMQRINQQYCDVSFFLAQAQQRKVGRILGRPKEDFEDYKELNEGILTIDAPSGLINKFKDSAFAIGHLKTLKTRSAMSRERFYNSGATVADVKNVGWAFSKKYDYLHIGSQNANDVHSRGAKVTGERPQDVEKRM